MTVLQREFYCSARGLKADDQDVWSLMFDRATGELLVRHEWDGERHSGVGIAEFLTQSDAASAALLRLVFADAPHDA